MLNNWKKEAYLKLILISIYVEIISKQEKFEDAIGIIRSPKSKKIRQYKGQKKEDNLQNLYFLYLHKYYHHLKFTYKNI